MPPALRPFPRFMSRLSDADRGVALYVCVELVRLRSESTEGPLPAGLRDRVEMLRKWALTPRHQRSLRELLLQQLQNTPWDPSWFPMSHVPHPMWHRVASLTDQAPGKTRYFVESTWSALAHYGVDDMSKRAASTPWARTTYAPTQLRKLPAAFQVAWDLVSSCATVPEDFYAMDLERALVVHGCIGSRTRWARDRPLMERITLGNLDQVGAILGCKPGRVDIARTVLAEKEEQQQVPENGFRIWRPPSRGHVQFNPRFSLGVE